MAALTTDEQDSVRLLAVEDCAALGRLLPREECVYEVGRCTFTRAPQVDSTQHPTLAFNP